MSERDPSSNKDIDELVLLASSFLTHEAFSAGLDDSLSDALLSLHSSIAQRYGARAASRACAKLGGVAALQQLLKASHKRKLHTQRESRLMNEIDLMLLDTSDIDRIRGQ